MGFWGSSFGVWGSKLASNSTNIERKIGKTLLEYSVKNPQMDAPNGLRENRKLLINQSASTSNSTSTSTSSSGGGGSRSSSNPVNG